MKNSFSEYLSIIYHWKKFLIINLLIITIITTVISFLIPIEYKATSTVMINQSKNSNLLGSLNSNVGSLIGSALFGGTGKSVDKMFGYLESRKILLKVIKKFNLVSYYEIKKFKRDLTLKALRNDAEFELTDNGFIKISVINKNPQMAANIVNYFVDQLDSLNKEYSISYAKKYRMFVQKRYMKNISDLNKAENQLERFQEKNKIYAIPAQFEIAFKAMGKLESDLVLKQLEADLIKATQGANSPSYTIANEQVKILKQKLNTIGNGKHLTNQSIIFFNLDSIPRLQKEYFRIKQEMEIQSKLLEYTLPMYEQALMEEQKNLPVVVVLDKAIPPELKYSPKRAFIILSVFFLFLFIFIFFIYRGELAIIRKHSQNIFEEKESRFFNRIKNFYKIKI